MPLSEFAAELRPRYTHSPLLISPRAVSARQLLSIATACLLHAAGFSPPWKLELGASLAFPPLCSPAVRVAATRCGLGIVIQRQQKCEEGAQTATSLLKATPLIPSSLSSAITSSLSSLHH